MAILKVRERRTVLKSIEYYTYYIPTWRIIQVIADDRGIKIYTEALRGFSEGSSESDYARIPFDDDALQELSKEKRLKIAEAIAEEIVKLVDDKSTEIIDADEFAVKMKILS
jgi:hypothetical protein